MVSNSNFTFFLNDPVNRDQIKQKENSTIIGFQSEYDNKLSDRWLFKLGTGLRNDNNKDVALSHTVNGKKVLEYFSLGTVNQTNLFTYSSLDFTSGKCLVNAGLRLIILNLDTKINWPQAIQIRHRPKRSVVTKVYCITDFSENYQIKKVLIGVNIDNIFDTKWKQT